MTLHEIDIRISAIDDLISCAKDLRDYAKMQVESSKCKRDEYNNKSVLYAMYDNYAIAYEILAKQLDDMEWDEQPIKDYLDKIGGI